MRESLKEAALAAFSRLMVPVAHMMLRCGVSWKELADTLKLAYVATATEQFGKHGRPANVSRVAILTGMGRREVGRLRRELERPKAAGTDGIERINRASRVLSAWHQDPDFVTAGGKPRRLVLQGPRSFEALVKRYAPDIPPTAMLKELKSVGAVGETSPGKLRALTRSFIPSGLDTESIARFGSVVGDIGATIAHNHLLPQRRARFERRATNARVKSNARAAFRRLVEERGMELLRDSDQWLTDHEAADASEHPARIGVGVYLIMDD